MSTLARAWTATVAVGAALAAAGTIHAAYNARRLRVAAPASSAPDEPISVLLPCRNEAERVGPTLASLLAQDLPELQIVVLDDGSEDGTSEVIRSIAGEDPRVELVQGSEALPEGWLGKPWACHRLSEKAHGSILIFLDADVLLAPDAVARTAATLRESGLDLISPYPKQIAVSPMERLVQPLLQWSWLTTLPLGIAERSPRESLSAANGQLLAVDAAAYRRAGGHASVREEVLEDVALLRSAKRAGGRGGVTDGTDIATCRMYSDADELVAGYTKSLWSAFGSPAGAVGVCAGMTLAYLVPPAAIVAGPHRARVLGVAGYAAGVAGRHVAARRTGQHVWPDVLAHPGSIAAFISLVGLSLRGKARGSLTWRGRPIG